MTRTAFSPYIYEYKDYAVGFVGAAGELLAQSTGGMPVFVADSVGMAVRDGLEIYGRGKLAKGGVVFCNPPAGERKPFKKHSQFTAVFSRAAQAQLICVF